MAGEAGLGMQGIGAIFAMLGAYQSAQGQKANLRGQAAIADINATTAERSAQAALMAGQHEEQRSMLATANLKSTQKVGFAAGGIDLGEGSAARTLTSTDVMGEIDKNTIAANAVRSAWGYRTQATSFENEAMMKRSGADSISPAMAAGTSLLNSAGSVAQNWYALNKSGALDNGTSGGHTAYWKY